MAKSISELWREDSRPRRSSYRQRCYFSFMGKVWSVSPHVLAKLEMIIGLTGCVPDVEKLPGVRCLKRAPSGVTVQKIEPDKRRNRE